MRKLFLGIGLLLGLSVRTAAAPLYGYVQITTTTALTPTLQAGAINISSGSIQRLTLPFGVGTTTATFSGAVTISSLTVTNSVTASSASINGPLNASSGSVTNTMTAGTFSGSGASLTSLPGANITGTIPAGALSNAILLQNTLQSGATFYVSSGTANNFIVSQATVTTSLAMNSQKILNLANGTAAADAATYHQVKILNLTSSSVTASSTTTTSSFIKSNLSASITPSSSSSQVRISAYFTGTSSNIGFTCAYKITRNGTDITTGPLMYFGGAGTATGTLNYSVALAGLDSPSSTSSTTYEVSLENLSGSITCGLGNGSNKSVIILEEVNGL